MRMLRTSKTNLKLGFSLLLENLNPPYNKLNGTNQLGSESAQGTS